MLKSPKLNCLVATAITISLVVSFSFSTPKKADAFWGFADAPIDSGANILTSLKSVWTAYLANQSWWKDWILDPIAYAVAQEVLSNVTESTVNWINNGFEGSPLYDVNFGDSIKEGLNEASGIMIDKMGGAGICDNLKDGLGFSFQYAQPFEYKMRCTLGDAIDNVEEFYTDFTKGGWRGWVTMTVNPQNNPYGAYITTLDEYNTMRAKAKEEIETEIDAGNGIKSYKTCDEYTTPTTPTRTIDPTTGEAVDGPPQKGTCKHWTIKNPGKIIEGRLSKATGVDFTALGAADEMSEILSALLQQAMKAIFEEGSTSDSSGNGGGGLTGAKVGIDVTPLTLKEEMDTLRLNLDIYYDYFVKPTASAPRGTHVLIREKIWNEYASAERYWRLARYCAFGGKTDGEGVEATAYLKDLTTAMNNEMKEKRRLDSLQEDINAVTDLYSDGFKDPEGNRYKGVYDPFYKNAGWSNVTSKILSKWKSKLSDIENMQQKDLSDLEMAEMAYDPAKSKYKDKCCSIDFGLEALCQANPMCNVCKINIKVIKIDFCAAVCPCSDMANKCQYKTGNKYRYCEAMPADAEDGSGSIGGQACKRGDTCQGGEMRPTLDTTFCCVGGTCSPDANANRYNTNPNTQLPQPIPPDPEPVNIVPGSSVTDSTSGSGGSGNTAGCRYGSCSANQDLCGPNTQFTCTDNCGNSVCDTYYGTPNCCIFAK